MDTHTGDILQGRHLAKSYGSGPTATAVLKALDISIAGGEFVAVMGPSGCGKSTLLHVLGLMTPQDDGEIIIDGQPVGRGDGVRTVVRRKRIGFVFQRFNLIATLNAWDNVALSLRIRSLRAGAATRQLFEDMGVGRLLKRKPSAMSIGEQQRVAMVRAVAHRPAILLADEPTGNLDSENSEMLLALLRRMNKNDGQTILMITHSADAAARADRVVKMKDGRLV